MRKSPIAIALLALLGGGSAVASDTFDSALQSSSRLTPEQAAPVDRSKVAKYDKQIVESKKTAILGTMYEDEELEDLRQMLNNRQIQRNIERNEQISFPLTPEEIKDRRKKIIEAEKAQMEPLNGVDFRIRNISYQPESNQPLVVEVANGFAAQLEFYDSSGQPWSIRKDGMVGDQTGFARRIMGEHRHIASFTLVGRYKQSNAAVILEGLPTTIPILLKSSDTAVDARISVTIPRMGPNGEIQPILTHEMNSVSPELVRLQSGDSPSGSKKLKVSGIENSEAWYDGEHLYLSLPGRLLLPPPINSSISPTGRYLYKVSPATHISVSLNGERRNGTVENLYQVDIRRASTIFDRD